MEENGFAILPDVLDKREVFKLRKLTRKYFMSGGGMEDCAGFHKPDFLKEPSLKEMHYLANHPIIMGAFEIITGEKVIFLGHNDMQMNRVAAWHKDRLNRQYAKYQTLDPWEILPDGTRHKIYKVGIYLQDHRENNNALKVKLGSHITESMTFGKETYLHPKLGDICLFDQRITHRGQESQDHSSRILIALGFGADNIFSHQFRQGTIARQNWQNIHGRTY